MLKVFHIFIISLLLLNPFVKFLQAQTQIELVNANTLLFDKKNGADIKKLIGNVILKHNYILLYCDSAYLYSATNKADAFGNVHIRESDTMNIYADMLTYNGNTKLADFKN
jgi:lipopolysaccharide assembly outer membrane protein LptD (OstA)